MNPSTSLQNVSPDCLPIDHNLPHLLKQVSGNADLVSVRDIKLRVISREMSLQRLALFVPNLRELNLDGSCLGSLRDLGCGLTSLEILRVSRCGLESLDGTFGLTSLRELHASNNMVDDVGPCSSLPHIRLIDLRKNAIEDTSFLEFLNICPHLEDLTLAECPAASKPGYRSTIRNMLPNLAILDGIPLTEEDEEADEENSDDTTDNDDDEDGDDSHPDHDTIRPTSRGDAFQFRPETPQYPRRRGAFGDGLRNVSQRPSFNENIQENEVTMDDKGTVIARPDMSNEADSLDCSSSACQADIYQTFPNFHSTQSSSSDTVLVQNLQTPRRTTFKKRSATSVDKSDVSLELPRSLLKTSTPRKPRSSSAIVMSGFNASDKGETTGASVGDPRCDSPSTLTSGLVVYGNLTVALRSRRKRQDIWMEEEVSSAFKPTAVMQDMKGNQTVDEKQMASTADDGSGEGQELRGEEPAASMDSRDVLEESKKWREIYTAYGSDNRMRWGKESEVDEVETTAALVAEEEKLTQDETKIKAEENICGLRKKIVDTATPCSHIFTTQKPICETSYYADTSSSINLSSKNVKVNRKKSALSDNP